VGEFVSFTGSGVIVLRITFKFHFHTNSMMNLIHFLKASCKIVGDIGVHATPVIFRVRDWKHNSFGFHHHFQ